MFAVLHIFLRHRASRDYISCHVMPGSTILLPFRTFRLGKGTHTDHVTIKSQTLIPKAVSINPIYVDAMKPMELELTGP